MRPKILIVDDKQANIIALERLLENLHVEIITSSSGNDAVFKAMDTEFALMLIDVQMPEMNGFETAEYIQKEKINRHTPIIFVSAVLKDDYYQIKGVESGGIDFLAKPLNEKILIGKVKLFLKLYEDKVRIQEYSKRIEIESNQKNKLLEKKLHQAQKMEALGTLAGGIAHDFNNILTSILGYAEIAQEQVLSDESMYNNFNQIIHAGNRAKKLVKQILAFSHRYQEEKIPLQLHLIVKEAINFLRSTIPSTIKIVQFIDDTEPGAILADPTQIHQIIMNLCTNAYQAMKDNGGVLTITLRNIHVNKEIVCETGSIIPFGEYIKIEVQDTGVGMDKLIMEKIFNPYFTTKKMSEGTGLGLSVVLGIVNNYNGHINVDSKPGKGTTFRVYLPKLELKQVKKKNVAKKTTRGGSERILIVDDEESIIKLLEKILISLGYKVDAFTNGKSLLKAFMHTPEKFDLLITDMTMPDLNGADLSQQILEIRPDFPIIILSGYSASIDQDKAKAIGINKFLMKPVSKKDIANAVREVLDQ